MGSVTCSPALIKASAEVAKTGMREPTRSPTSSSVDPTTNQNITMKTTTIDATRRNDSSQPSDSGSRMT
jgi:hypothetical protein